MARLIRSSISIALDLQGLIWRLSTVFIYLVVRFRSNGPVSFFSLSSIVQKHFPINNLWMQYLEWPVIQPTQQWPITRFAIRPIFGVFMFSCFCCFGVFLDA